MQIVCCVVLSFGSASTFVACKLEALGSGNILGVADGVGSSVDSVGAFVAGRLTSGVFATSIVRDPLAAVALDFFAALDAATVPAFERA